MCPVGYGRLWQNHCSYSTGIEDGGVNSDREFRFFSDRAES